MTHQTSSTMHNSRALSWQNRALARYQELYALKDSFVIVGGTGVGKTDAGCMCAQYAMQEEAPKNPFLVVVCPWRSIKRGWKRAFSRHGIRATTNNLAVFDPELDGAAITYASASTILPLIMKMDRPLIIVFDEFHHMEAMSAWAAPFTSLYENGNRPLKTILLSGTPWRESGSLPQCLVSYGPDDKVLDDFSYSYGDNLEEEDEDRNTVLVQFHEQHGSAIGRAVDRETGEPVGPEMEVKTEGLKADDSLRPFVDFSVQNIQSLDVACRIIDNAVTELKNQRLQYSYVAGLVVTSGKSEAKAVEWYLKTQHEKDSVVVISDDPKAHSKIESFRKDLSAEWIIAVDMISEGVDVPRLKVEVDLTDKKTPMHIVQRWGRVLRRPRDESGNFMDCGTAHVFFVAHPKLMEMAAHIEDDIRKAKAKHRPGTDGGDPPMTRWVTDSQDARGENLLARGEYIEREVDSLARWMWDTNYRDIRQGRRGHIDAILVARVIIESIYSGAAKFPPGYIELSKREEPKRRKNGSDPDDERGKLVKQLVSCVGTIAYAIGEDGSPDYATTNTSINRRMGWPSGKKWESSRVPLSMLRERIATAKSLAVEVGVPCDD